MDVCSQKSSQRLPHALRGKQDELPETLGIGHLEYHVHCNSSVNHVLKGKGRDIDYYVVNSYIVF